jgi:hypothetical protein
MKKPFPFLFHLFPFFAERDDFDHVRIGILLINCLKVINTMLNIHRRTVER